MPDGWAPVAEPNGWTPVATGTLAGQSTAHAQQPAVTDEEGNPVGGSFTQWFHQHLRPKLESAAHPQTLDDLNTLLTATPSMAGAAAESAIPAAARGAQAVGRGIKAGVSAAQNVPVADVAETVGDALIHPVSIPGRILKATAQYLRRPVPAGSTVAGFDRYMPNTSAIERPTPLPAEAYNGRGIQVQPGDVGPPIGPPAEAPRLTVAPQTYGPPGMSPAEIGAQRARIAARMPGAAVPPGASPAPPMAAPPGTTLPTVEPQSMAPPRGTTAPTAAPNAMSPQMARNQLGIQMRRQGLAPLTAEEDTAAQAAVLGGGDPAKVVTVLGRARMLPEAWKSLPTDDEMQASVAARNASGTWSGSGR